MNPHGIRAFAPGRVNLIGEHTDYNLGLCLPFAVDRGATVTADLHDGGEIVASGLPDDDPYLRGAVAELRAAGVDLPGCSIAVDSDLPQEAGLSSSAALSIALVLALTAAAGAPAPEPADLARMCQRIETEYTGAETGLLDQLASILGEEGRAVRLDMRTLEARAVDVDLGEHVLAVLDSGSSRSLAESGYNERRAECRRAAELLGVESLRDATDWSGLPDPLGRRVRHVVSENERVDAAVRALERRDPPALGELLDASHRSLRDDYEVSVPDVERAVEACREAGALGARIMGGGFGGSVLALFPPGADPPSGALRVAPCRGARVL
ncbi:MAG TPA: galactokinase family protein [Thermoleophilaceae bacterium]|nr:galactokinase family protein [Thermoleophilaceae bacterium]